MSDDQIITLPREMPEWACEQEREIKKAMADLECEYNQRAKPLVKALCDLYAKLPERIVLIRREPWFISRGSTSRGGLHEHND